MPDTPKQARRPIHLSEAIADPDVGLLAEPESLLNDSKISPHFAGVIRPGIKVPYEKGPSALTPQELQTYNKMFREKRSPDEIEKALGKSLQPFNVPYFSVYRSECLGNPDHADRIRALYGDAEGRIHRLKVILVSENWWEYLPHNLAAFRKSGLYCSSRRIDGKLVASRLPDPADDPREGRAGDRAFKRERITLPCIPDQCPIYQSKDCRFSGVLHFMILGIPGADLWRLPSTSWHAIGGIYKKLKAFQSLLRKRGRGLVGIPFTLYKVQKNIAYWEEGKGFVRGKQWIFRIDSPELPVSNFIVQTSGFVSSRPEEDPGPKERGLASTTGGEIDAAPDVDEPVAEATGPPSPADARVEISPSKVEAPEPLDATETAEAPPVRQKAPARPEAEALDLQELGKKIYCEIDPIGKVPLKVVQDFLAGVGKQEFDALRFEEASALHQKVLEAKKTVSVVVCASCQAALTQTVAAYSKEKYKRPLCLLCQNKNPSRLPHRSVAPPKAQGQVTSFF